jgi:hypothetical protein
MRATHQISGRGPLVSVGFTAMMPRLSFAICGARMSADYTLPPPRRPRPPTAALSGGDGGSTLDPMEARVARLEDDMREIKADLKAIRADLADLKPLRLEVAEIKGRVSQLPSTKEMIALVVGVMGMVAVILRFGTQ